jgi:prepilin-type N-terminal cleavage/methylation domain-containing protein
MLAKLQKRKQDDGFTLVELLVVIAILGILAGIVVF